MSVSIGTNYYSNLLGSLNTANSADGLSGTLGRISDDSTDEELMEACKSFESYFVEQLFKGMEKTVMKDEEEEENDYLTNFKDILYQNVAQDAVEQESFGIAKVLYESMKRV